jgi:hypothetical protein
MISDISFEDAFDVRSIRYRLHPLDVGFDVRAERVAVEVAQSDADGLLRVTYAARNGDRRVMHGPRAEVIARLRKLGYRIDDAGGRA